MSGILNKLGFGGNTNSSSTSANSTQNVGSMNAVSAGSTGTSGAYGNTHGTTGTTGAYGNTHGTTGTTGTYANNQDATGAYANNHRATDASLTRSEDQLLVGKEQVGAGVASLNKYVTTEHAQTSVPITKEHVVVERTPITNADHVRGSKIGEQHIEVPLTEERAVATKETVPIEKVNLRKEAEHTSQNVDAELRKEHIEYGNTNEGGKVLGAAPGTVHATHATQSTHNSRV